jgi:predicted transcriptional regulator of viral defense system
VPRYSVTGSTPDWPGLHRLLYEQQGYFTAAQAHGHSISPALLRYHVDSGAFERVMRGVYRLSTFPPTPAEDLVVFWLWSDRHGVFSHATALLQHRLSDALPGSTCMTVPAAWRSRRLQVPPGLHLHYADLPPRSHVWIDGVPVTRPLRTVVDCIEHGVSLEITADALRDALDRGLFSRPEYLAELRAAGIDRRQLPKELR